MESKGHHRGRKEEIKGHFEVKQRRVGREIMSGGISLITQMSELSMEWHLFTVRFGSRCRRVECVLMIPLVLSLITSVATVQYDSAMAA